MITVLTTTSLLLLATPFGVATVEGFSLSSFSPPLLGIGAIFSPPPSNLRTNVVGGDPQTLLDASEFFCDAFWTNKVGGGAKTLSSSQRKTLRGSQFAEFRQRYAGQRRGQSELIIMERPPPIVNKANKNSNKKKTIQIEPSNNNRSYNNFFGNSSNNNDQSSRPEIVGCAGIQVSPIPDGKLNGPTVTNAPLMANVAVSTKYRRKGIGEKIVKEVEQVCRYQWGYNDVYLYVEERNKAALRLYQKLGYRRIWTDDTAQTLLPTSNGKLENAPTKIVCMRKRLDLGLLGRILPF